MLRSPACIIWNVLSISCRILPRSFGWQKTRTSCLYDCHTSHTILPDNKLFHNTQPIIQNSFRKCHAFSLKSDITASQLGNHCQHLHACFSCVSLIKTNTVPWFLYSICQHLAYSSHVTSSSYYWALVANGPNVLQPYWLIVLPLDVPGLTAGLLLWGPSGQRWRCLWTF